MKLNGKEFYWCETPEEYAVFKNESAIIEFLKETVDNKTDIDDVGIWHLEKISEENFNWAQVGPEELLYAALTEPSE